jgi:hypothetical protein
VDSGGLIDRRLWPFDLENDSGGLWRTINPVHGIQKVRTGPFSLTAKKTAKPADVCGRWQT